jgi:hypothetical protein
MRLALRADVRDDVRYLPSGTRVVASGQDRRENGAPTTNQRNGNHSRVLKTSRAVRREGASPPASYDHGLEVPPHPTRAG